MGTFDELQSTISELVQPGKGILAADESTGTITKRFGAVGIDSNEDTRRQYRQLLIATPGIGEYVNGIILFEETLQQQADDGTPIPELCRRQGIVPGIKVDKGFTDLPHAPGDKITQGLDGLSERLARYKEAGARFTKWREVYPISPQNPTPLGIEANAEVLARYAAAVQAQGLVPIVEPEVLIDGDHSIERCALVTHSVLHALFHALNRHCVVLEHMVLKPSMVIPGKAHANKASPEQVAQETLKVFRRNVPAAVASINFLSGGQTPEEASANLSALNAAPGPRPWPLTFSFARALQDPVMKIWQGKAENAEAAQQAFLKRARLNSAATKGEYNAGMEAAA